MTSEELFSELTEENQRIILELIEEMTCKTLPACAVLESAAPSSAKTQY